MLLWLFLACASGSGGEGEKDPPSLQPPPPAAPQLPGIPTQLSVTPGNAQASLAWTAPSSDGGSSITGYFVMVSLDGALVKTETARSASLTVTGLTNGRSYSFMVAAENTVGRGAASAPISVTPYTVPGAPTQLGVTPGNARVTVSWTAPIDDGGSPITGYRVTVQPGGTTVNIGAGEVASTVTGLTNGSAYRFTVVALNAAGIGASSESAAVTPVGPPRVPTALTAVPFATAVELTWAAPSAEGSAITGYVITVSSSGSTVKTETVSTTNHVVLGLTNGQSYTFTVMAENAVGRSAATAPVSATPRTTPSQPLGVVLNVGAPNSREIIVSWRAPQSDGGSPITRYVVEAWDGQTRVAEVASTTTSATATGLVIGRTYGFRVRAENAAGPSTHTTFQYIKPVGSPQTPPLDFVAKFNNESVALSWDYPVNDGASPVSGFIVTYWVEGSSTVSTLKTPNTRLLVDFLKNGVTYVFTVAAENQHGLGVATEPITEMPRSVPAEPTSVRVTPGNAQLTVSWSPPADTGGIPLDSYLVRALDSEGRETTVSVISTITSVVVEGLLNGTAYSITVEAHNQVGWGRPSTALSATPQVDGGLSSLIEDLNGDGLQDLVVGDTTTDEPEVKVQLHGGPGSLLPAASYTVGAKPTLLVVADINEDGAKDLVVADRASTLVEVLLGRGDGTFEPAVASDVVSP
jgi:titin